MEDRFPVPRAPVFSHPQLLSRKQPGIGEVKAFQLQLETRDSRAMVKFMPQFPLLNSTIRETIPMAPKASVLNKHSIAWAIRLRQSLLQVRFISITRSLEVLLPRKPTDSRAKLQILGSASSTIPWTVSKWWEIMASTRSHLKMRNNSRGLWSRKDPSRWHSQ